jgi:hypothetical protein
LWQLAGSRPARNAMTAEAVCEIPIPDSKQKSCRVLQWGKFMGKIAWIVSNVSKSGEFAPQN